MYATEGISALLTTLPFTGRRKELKHIQKFSQAAWEQDSLSMLWIVGEAGIGKSRLLLQAQSTLYSRQVVNLDICLYPDSTTSIISLLSDAMNTPTQFPKLLPTPVTNSIPSVTAAIRRLGRLRPVVIFLQDLHLANKEAAEELVELLNRLTNEPLAVICTTRPGTSDIYKRTRQHQAGLIELQALSRNDLWSILQHHGIRKEWKNIADILHTRTSGNPLVLRAVLPELLTKLQQILPSQKEVVLDLINENLRETLLSLPGAFLGSLPSSLHKTVYQLASLGEIFSVEAVSLFCTNPEETLSELMQHGIVTKSLQTIMPITGQASTPQPYTFTHSLLYEDLLKDTVADTEILLSLFEQKLPVYSLTPWKLIAESSLQNQSRERFTEFVEHLCETIHTLQLRELRHQEFAIKFQQILHSVCQNNAERFDKNADKELYIKIVHTRLYSVSATMHGSQHSDIIQEYLSLTQDPEDENIAAHHCLALSYLVLSQGSIQQVKAATATVVELADRFPEIWKRTEFINIIGHIAMRTKDMKSCAFIRDLILKALSIEHNLAHNSRALINTASQLTSCYTTNSNTPEQIAEGTKFIEQVRKTFVFEDELPLFFLQLSHVNILIHSGKVLEAKKLLESASNPRIFEAHVDTIFFARRLLYTIEFALCTDTTRIDQDIAEHLEPKQVPNQPAVPRSHIHLAFNLITDGILSGDIEWARAVATRLCNGDASLHRSHMAFVEAVLLRKLNQNTPIPELPEDTTDNLAMLANAALQKGGDRDALITEAKRLLDIELCTLRTFLQIQLVISLIEAIAETNPAYNFVDLLRKDIETALRNALTWAEEHNLPGFMKPFLQFTTKYLPQKEAVKWQEQIAKLQERVAHHRTLHVGNITTSNWTTISMIERITIQRPGHAPEPVQGARVRHVLGMMIANAMMPTPLSYADFRELATEKEGGEERAANYLRTLIARIRKMIGRENVITNGEDPPHLNLESTHVDLLKISDLLKQANDARHSRYPRKAKDAIVEALNILHDGPVFPGLYGEFFDAARLEFDRKLRDEVLGTAQFLEKEGDYVGAVEILRPAFRFTPFDDEITDILTNALDKLGQHTEAISTRKQWERAVQGV